MFVFVINCIRDADEEISLKSSNLGSLVNSIPTSRGPISMQDYIMARMKAVNAGLFGL